METRAVLKVALIYVLFTCNAFAQTRINELNAYWNVVKAKVESGDVAGYGATFHEDGILVADRGQVCYSLNDALIKWKDGLGKTKEGLTKVNLDFRFSDRTGDHITAFEKGIFRHELLDEKGEIKESITHFEALLTKTTGKWLIMLEHQKSPATKEEWLSLSKIE